MLHRLIAPKGCGKRDRLLSLAAELCRKGEKVLFLVPEQITADTEKDLIVRCGASCNEFVEVTNFSRLTDLVHRRYGGLAAASVSRDDLLLILARLIREGDSLKLEKELLPRLHSVRELRSLFEECEELHRNGPNAASLTEMTESRALDESLEKKLYLLASLRTALDEAVRARYGTASDPQDLLIDVLRKHPFFEDYHVLLDGFWDFTVPQEAILREMLRSAKDVWVSLTADFHEEQLFAVPIRAARRLYLDAKSLGVSVKDEFLPQKEDPSDLAFFKNHLFRPAAPRLAAPQGIRLVSCRNAREQALMIADRILTLAANGVQWNEIAVLSRSGESDEIIFLTLEQHGIPSYLETKRPILTSTAAATALLACQIALGDTAEETVRKYLKFAVLDVDDEELCLLEKYACVWSLSGPIWLHGRDFTMNPNGYDRFTEQGRKELEKVNRARRIIFEPLRHLAMALSKGTVEEKVSALISFLNRVGTQKVLFEEIEKKKKEKDYDGAGATIRQWNALLERLSALTRAVGDAECDPKTFLFYLEIALSGDLPGAIPPGQDRVQIGRIGMHRTAARYLFLPDCNAGVFPHIHLPSGIITVEEREQLERHGYALSGSELRQNHEFFLFYSALASAREEVCLSYRCTTSTEKDSGAMSIFLKRLLTLFPDFRPTVFDPCATMPKTREAAFSHWVRHLTDEGDLTRQLQDYFENDPEYRTRCLEAVAGKAFLSEPYFLAEEKPYRNEDLFLSSSAFETYVKCPFSYFGKYLLRAKPSRRARLAPNHAGTLIHAVLEIVLRDLSLEQKTLSDLDDEELIRRNQKACQTALREEFSDTLLSERFLYLVRLLSRSSLLLLQNLKKEFSRSGFSPIAFELKIANLPEEYTVPLPDGRKIKMTGTIDRVDLYRAADGTPYVRVVDYKTGGKKFNLDDVANGLNLQMLLYLFALWSAGITIDQKKELPQPAGILYLNGLDAPKTAKNLKEISKIQKDPFSSLDRDGLLVDDPELLRVQDPDGTGEFLLGGKKSAASKLISLQRLGKLKQKVETDLAAAISALKDGKIDAVPLDRDGTPCEYCDWKAICRRSNARCRAMIPSDPKTLFGEEENVQ